MKYSLYYLINIICYQKEVILVSMPTIPDIKPKIEISFEETIKLLLVSVALEELSLAHIMNAEAEKFKKS